MSTAFEPKLARRERTNSVWIALRTGCRVALATHVLLTVWFLTLDLRWLALLNVGSVATFAVASWMLGRRRNLTALWLIASEVVIHAGTATLALGWSSGFQYYLLAMVTPLAVSGSSNFRLRMAAIVALGICFELLDTVLLHRAARIALPPVGLAGLRVFNVAASLLIMATHSRLLRRNARQQRTLASTDPLTGLLNRRELLAVAGRTRQGPPPPGRDLHVLLGDIDHFKVVNDAHGHVAGDRALQLVAGLLAAASRPEDALARWGGEEFLVLLHAEDLARAAEVAERLRLAVATTPCPMADGTPLRLTMTFGVASVDRDEPITAAVARADAALYRGKAAGRDRVEVAASAVPADGKPAAAPGDRIEPVAPERPGRIAA